MNDAQLNAFREIAEAMRGPEAQDWQWIGPHVSQRVFGISERRAKSYAEAHGGHARRMDSVLDRWSRYVGMEVNTGIFNIKGEVALVQNPDGSHKLALIIKAPPARLDMITWALTLGVKDLEGRGLAITDVPPQMEEECYAEARKTYFDRLGV